MILFNNGSGEASANAAFAFLANCKDVNRVLHGSKDGDEGKEEAACLFCCCSQGLVVVCCFNDNALIVGAVDKEKAFHGFEEERLAPREITIQHEGGRSPLVNKTQQCLRQASCLCRKSQVHLLLVEGRSSS